MIFKVIHFMDYNYENFAKPNISSKGSIASTIPYQTKSFVKLPPPSNRDAQAKINLLLQSKRQPITKAIPLNAMPKPKPKIINLCHQPQKFQEEEKYDDVKSFSQPKSESKYLKKFRVSYLTS